MLCKKVSGKWYWKPKARIVSNPTYLSLFIYSRSIYQVPLYIPGTVWDPGNKINGEQEEQGPDPGAYYLIGRHKC